VRTCLALFAAVVFCVATAGCGRSEEEPRAATGEQPRAAGPEVVTTAAGIGMVAVPAGTFRMGSADGEDDEEPVREVTVGAFLMDRYEVTQGAFEKLMGRNPSKWKAPDRPVEQASWLAAVRYCNARSMQEWLTACYDVETLACDFAADGYRLPTEAEWEYACRAGTDTDYSFGSSAADLARYAWFKANSGAETHPVGGKLPNPWGLFDMHGNVAEWCQDYYGEDYYAEGQDDDPRGPREGDERVLRGGSWKYSGDLCRSSARYSEAPGLADVCFGYDAYGFRCVRRAPAAD
jgi:formylglycine-generating enzyme required for sulfatase activity